MINKNFEFKISANTFEDPEHGPLTYEMKKLDNATAELGAWLKFDKENLKIKGIPPKIETISINFTAKDNGG